MRSATSGSSEKLTIIFLIILLVASFCTIAYLNGRTRDALLESSRTELRSIAGIIATGIDGDALAAIGPGDEESAAYLAVQADLNRIRAANPDIRYLCTLQQNGDGVIFVVDADYGLSADAASIGQACDSPDPDLLEGFNGPSADLRISDGAWGTVFSGYAPIRDDTGSTIGIVRVDMDSGIVANRLNYIEKIQYFVIFPGMLIIGIGAIANDVSRTRVNALVKRRLNEQDALLSTMPAGVFFKSSNLEYIAINPVYASMLGTAPDGIIGRSDTDLLPPERAAFSRETDRTVLETGMFMHDIPESVTTSDGDTQWFITSKTPFRDDRGTIVGIVGVSVDITDRKRSEMALAESRNYLDALFNSVRTGIAVIDAENHTVVDINPAASALIGRRKEDIVGKQCTGIICTAENGRCPISGHDQRADNTERILIGDGGREIPVLTTVVPVLYRNRRYLIESFIDITECKLVEEKTSMINQCFLTFGTDPEININQLTQLCGRMMHADCAIYHRLDKEALICVGAWQVPEEFRNPQDWKIFGDIIHNEGGHEVVVPDLRTSLYYILDPDLANSGLATCVGRVVKIGDSSYGCISVFYRHGTTPSDWELQMLGIVASAIGIEEERRKVQEDLTVFNKELEWLIWDRTAYLEQTIVKLEEEIEERKRAEGLTALQRDLGIALGSAEDVEDSMKSIQEAISKIGGIDAGMLSIINPADDSVTIMNAWGFSRNDFGQKGPDPAFTGIFGRLQEGTPCYFKTGEISQIDGIFAGEGLQSIGLIPIRHEGETFAVLVVAAHTLGTIPEAARMALESIAAQIGGVIARVRAAEEVQASLEQKMMMLQEIHHRVKNNLAIVSGLLRMQSASITDERVLGYLQECENRIISMALVHDSLYRSKNFEGVDAGEHFRNLASQIIENSSADGKISLGVDGGGVFLELEKAIPCSLIVNELLTNSVKYAFDGRERGNITILIRENPDMTVSLIYSDDGVGMPEDINCGTSRSLGLRLVWNLMTIQLKGTIHISRKTGTNYTMTFPVKRSRKTVSE